MKTYSIEQIRKYITSQDSLGDVLYNLSESNIEKANTASETKEKEMCESWCHGNCDCQNECEG